jgi:tryptophanyl-tRNA synthetase
MSKLVLSGIKPTGNIHIGNYFGAIKQFVDFQNNNSEFESRYFIADLHALTSVNNKEALQRSILDSVKTYIAAGLDPHKTLIFKQSDIPEVTELTWIFNCLTTMPQLMRAHAFKDAEAKNKEVSVGLFDYPVLMAADILIHNTDIVPVGKDQKQHIEIAREIARKFNNTFAHVFVEPKESIIEEVETIIGTDGQKMSKSYGNVISLFATHEEITKAIMSIPTDSAKIEDSKNPDTNTIYKIHKLFLSEEENEIIRSKYLDGGMGYKEAKDLCIESIEKFISPIRQKYNSITDKEVIDILQKGKEKIRPIIEQRMEIIRGSIGTLLA